MSSGGPVDTGWRSPFSDPKPDPKAERARKARPWIILVAVIAVVAFAWGWNPPTTNVHKFSKASDYKPDRESGCTNSGKGCHGAEKTYRDFNVYHPNAKCTTCHDYQGVGCIPCHMPPEKECQLCHDGSMERAADVVKLTDPYPRGHYRETTHTAMGTPMDEPVRASEEGKASAKCEDCHSRDLAASHTDVPSVAGSEYKGGVGCGECHNDVRANGLAEVLSDWKGRACEDCHKTGSSSPQHGTTSLEVAEAKSPLSCGDTGLGCHSVNDLHLIHADKPKTCSGEAEEGEGSCHVIGAEAAKPNAITCGGEDDETCHLYYVNDSYTHARDIEVHSPAGSLAADTSFGDAPCGRCHFMDNDGTSLVVEHELATSEMSGEPGNVCVNCHNNEAAVVAVQDSWPERATSEACSTCHGKAGLPEAHSGDVAAAHAETSGGCSESGAGCHPTDDLSEVGAPTTTANIHRDCLRCHDWTKADGNQAYNPEKRTCGEGRDCHSASGSYVVATDVHNGGGGLADGTDSAHHAARAAQATATWDDTAAGTKTACGSCHSMILGTEHSRTYASPARGRSTLCSRCHNAAEDVSEVVKASWTQKAGTGACRACHVAGSTRAIHASIETSHVATELSASGTPQNGACARGGCHASLDLRVLHRGVGCTADGCHSTQASIFGGTITSCGGVDSSIACHAGFSENTHFTDHDANRSGTVNGVAYVDGKNVGCFGCHVTDLRVEHENARQAGTLEGGGSSSCAICHEQTAGAGSYAGATAVKRAIADRDARCASCHASGSKHDTAAAAASAHKNTSTAPTLPAGSVWSDPLDDWKAAFDGVTGSGHNALSAELVGGAVQKLFPESTFSIEGTTYVWALPPNSGQTKWLIAAPFPPGATDTTESIRHIRMTCADCHTLPAGMNGPHGSAVPIAIDPAYSQTEYANPSRDVSQFQATGTRRVVCFKCHPIYSGGIEGTTTPGGASLHARHVTHPDLDPSSKHYKGETCVDCHVRIPHAWKRPRMLIRTVVTTDGATPDAFPYVSTGHDGLLGIRLRSFNPQTQLRSSSCVVGSCHPASSPTRHPRPSDVPTATYWP
ncbi:MAG: cytochrome c3 family protein [Coriobacteriia bacterium]|nr:cytochrome c3 family protein [Coriobacteriia bacterium]